MSPAPKEEFLHTMEPSEKAEIRQEGASIQERRKNQGFYLDYIKIGMLRQYPSENAKWQAGQPATRIQRMPNSNLRLSAGKGTEE
jgi:hypothetical protein